MGTLVDLKNVRLSYPAIWTATDYEGDGNFKYRACLIFDRGSENEKRVRAAIEAAGKEKWADKAKAKLSKAEGTSFMCLHDGDEKDDDAYKGKLYISASNKVRPTIVDRDRTQLTEADGKPYAGCFVNAKVEIFAWEKGHGGVSASLKGLQFFRDGDAFTGASTVRADDFEEISDEEFADLVA